MAKAISNMFVAVGGDISALSASFAAGAKQVEGFVNHLDKASHSVSGFASRIPKLSSVLGTLGVAFSAASAASMVKGQLESVDALAKLSDRTGIATEQLVGLQHAADLAGISGEELAGGAEKLLKNLAAAANGSKEASAAFGALGLDASKLINLPTNEALAQVADGLSSVTNPAQRAALAMQIFGKSGQGLLPFLMAGSEGIRQAQQEVERLGLTISRTDAAKIEAANDAITSMKVGVTALAREFAVVLAPAIQSAADVAKGLADALRNDHGGERAQDVGRLRTQYANVAQAADQARQALAAANNSTPDAKAKAYADYLDKLREELRLAKAIDAATKQQKQIGPDGKQVQNDPGQRFGNVRVGPNVEQGFALQNVQHTAKFYDELSAKIAEAEGWTRQLGQAQAEAGQQSREAATQAAQAAQAQVDAAKEQERRQKAVADRVAELRTQYEQLGMSEDQKTLIELKASGATQRQLDLAATYLNQIAQAKRQTDAIEAQQKAQEKLADEAKRYYEETRTPAEKYADEIAHINDLLAAGALDPETARRAAEQAQKAFDAAKPKVDEIAADRPRLADAIRANSAEAQALRFTGGNQIRGAAAEVTAKNTAALVAAQGTANGHLATIAAASKPGNEIVIDMR